VKGKLAKIVENTEKIIATYILMAASMTPMVYYPYGLQVLEFVTQNRRLRMRKLRLLSLLLFLVFFSCKNEQVPENKALEKACLDQNISGILSVVKKPQELENFPCGLTPLHIAALMKGPKEILQEIKEEGVNTVRKTANYSRGLKTIVPYENFWGLEPSIGDTPLFSSIYSNNKDNVLILLVEGALIAYPSAYSNTKGYMPIHAAVEMGNVDIIEMIINEANVYLVTSDRNNVFHYLAYYGKLEIFPNLIEKIQSYKISEMINAKNNYGYTPLSIAVMKNDLQMFEALINEGADINIDVGNPYKPMSILRLALIEDSPCDMKLIKLIVEKIKNYNKSIVPVSKISISKNCSDETVNYLLSVGLIVLP